MAWNISSVLKGIKCGDKHLRLKKILPKEFNKLVLLKLDIWKDMNVFI